ncbi:MAG: tRNA-binding protein [Flavobacteriaceae bacterium]|nr:MAG: tRNA-binding protein [Flavobacteriaceae bacterium]
MSLKSTIAFEDFNKLDLRIGTIIKVRDFPKAHRPAFQLDIDFGPLGIKKSSAQITKLYTKETLLNKQIIANVNFKPKQIANYFSECLVLGVPDKQQNIVLLAVTSPVLNGTQVL